LATLSFFLFAYFHLNFVPLSSLKTKLYLFLNPYLNKIILCTTQWKLFEINKKIQLSFRAELDIDKSEERLS